MASIPERLDRLPFGRFHWMLVLTMFLATAFDNMDQIILSYVIPVFRQEWGISAVRASLLPAFGLSGTLLGAIFWGWIGDRIGRKLAFIGTVTVFSITSLINGFSWSFEQLVATCFFMGIGIGGEIPLAFTIITEFIPPKYRGRVEVLVGILAIGGGYAIASGSAYLLIAPFGWRALFFVGVLPAALIAVIARYIPESPRYLAATGKYEDAERICARLEREAGVIPVRPTAATGARLAATRENRRGRIWDLWTAAYRRRTALLWSYGLMWGFCNFGFLIWLPTLLGRVGFTAEQSALYASAMNGLAIPGALLTAWFFERWSTKWTLAAYPFVAALFTFGFGALTSGRGIEPAVLVGVGGMIFLTGASLAGVLPPYAAEVYPTELRGTGAGWAVALTRVGGLMGPVVGGTLVAAGWTVSRQAVVFGLSILMPAVIMAALGIETRGRRLEDIAPGH